MYTDGEYDLAGFIVGAAERGGLLTGKSIRAGDVLLRAAFDGAAHQRVFAGAQAAVRSGRVWAEDAASGGGGDGGRCAAGGASQLPASRFARCWRRDCCAARRTSPGGGITDNTPRMMPKEFRVSIDTGVVEDSAAVRSAAADRQHSGGRLPAHVESGRGDDSGGSARAAAVKAEAVLRKLGETPFRIGSVVAMKRGRPRVEYR